MTRPELALGRWWSWPPAHLRFTLVDSAATIPGVESAPETASTARTVIRRQYDAQVKTPPITPTHLTHLLRAPVIADQVFAYLMNSWMNDVVRWWTVMTIGSRSNLKIPGINMAVESANIVRDAVLVRVYRRSAWCDVGGWNHMEVILV